MAANVYESRRLAYVTPYTGSTIKYGFRTNVSSAVGVTCGHTPVDLANPPTGLTFGANSPKPGRASKRRTNGVDTTFYDIGQVAALRTAGYSLSPPRARRGGSGANSKTVYVTIGGIKYAWKTPTTSYNKIGAADRTALGIQDATATDDNLVFGASYPKPPRARKEIVGVDTVDTISTFCDPERIDSLPEGWSSSGVLELS